MKRLIKKKKHKLFFILLTLSLTIGIAYWILFLSPNAAKAAWFNDSWAYRKKVTFGNTGSADSNKKVKLDIDTAALITAGQIQSDCDDARFTDNNGLALQYYLDSGVGACNTSSTDFYVLVPTINAGNTDLYFYYGNPNASAGTKLTQFSQSTFSPTSGPTFASEEKGTPPVLYWAFDEGQGTSVKDGTTNQNHGTIASSNSPGASVKIDDSGDPGSIPGGSRQLVRTSSGTLYAFINDGGSCEIWSSSDGLSWTERDSSNNPSCRSTYSIAAAIDATDVIHLFYNDETNAYVSNYIQFTTSSNTFGSEQAVRTGTSTYFHIDHNIVVDSNNVPHVIFRESRAAVDHTIKYANRIGGTWSTAVTVANNASGDYYGASATINEDNIVEAIFYNASDGTMVAAVGNANNATSFSTHTFTGDCSDTCTYSIAVDSSGNTWVAFTNSGTIRLIKHNDADGWTTWQTALNSTSTGNQPSIAINSSDIYVLYENGTDDIVYNKYNGSSWEGEIALETGTYRDVKARWSYLNNPSYTTYGIDYLFSDATDNYHNFKSIATASGTVTRIDESRCAVGKCLAFGGGNVGKTYSSDTELAPGTGSISVSAWFKHSSSISGTDIIISRTDGVNGVGYKLYYDATSGVCFGIDQTAGSFPADSACTTTSHADSQWHFITGVKSGTSSITLYIDGKQVAQDLSITSSSISGTSTPVYVGTDADGSSNSWDGFIDEIKIYNYEKSAAQIKADYNNKSGIDGASATFGATDPAKSLAQGLVGYWKLDESSWTTDCSTTSITDSSGNSKNGKSCPGTGGTDGPQTTTGKFANAGSFDGSNDYVEVATPTLPTQNATYAAWVYLDTVSDEELFMASNGSGGNEVAINVGTAGSGRVNVIFDGTSVVTTSSNSVTTGIWTHIAVVRDGSETYVYINGIKDATASTPEGDTLNFSTCSLLIGADADSSCTGSLGNYLDGNMDEVRIYNRALSSIEVAALSDWAPAPVGYWNLDENTGTTANDTSGNSNTGTLTNGPKWDTGKYGGASSFDGTNDYITVADNNVLDITKNITVSAWINRTTTATSFPTIISKGGAGANSFAYVLNYNTDGTLIRFLIGDNADSYDIVSATAPTNNAWHHIVGYADESTVKIFIDGVQAASTTRTITTIGSTDNPVCIGTLSDDTLSANTCNASYYSGSIDEVKIYNYARTPKQIVSDMNAGHPGIGSPVGSATSHWNFDEGYGTTANDKSQNSNSLTLSSASWTNSGKINKGWNGTGSVWLTRADDNDFDFLASEDITISTWFKSDSANNPSNTEYLLSKGTITNTGTAGYILYVNTSGNVVFGVKDDTAWGASSPNTPSPDDTVTSTADIYDGTWHHIVATKTGTSRLDLYIDGKTNGTPDTSIAATSTLANSIALRVADDDADSANSFNGDLDELKIYRYALNSDEVKVEYNQGKAQVLGNSSTASDGSTADNSSAREYCVPGDTTSCSAPVGEWRLDEQTSTTAYDTSGNANDLTLTNTPTWTTGKVGAALNFSASNAQITRADDSDFDFTAGTSFTLELWFKHTTASAQQILMSKFNEAGYKLLMESDGDITCGIDYDSTWTPTDSVTSTAATYDDDVWHHAACVKNANSSLILYIDGIPVGTPDSSLTNSTLANSDPLYIGIDADGTSNDWVGKIDHVQIYNTARTQAQISWDYNRGAPIGWWKLDECTGTTAYDTLGLNNGLISPGSSGNTTTGNCNSGTSTEMWNDGTTGKFNGSVGFDGTDDQVDVGQIVTPTDNYSFSAWVKTTASGAIQQILSRDVGGAASTARQFQFRQETTGVLSLIRFDSSGNVVANFSTTRTINDGNWHHVVATFSTATGSTLYIDGNSAATNSTLAANGNAVGTGASTVIGGRYNGSSPYVDFFNGQIDDVRMYGYALTSAQIKTIYNENTAVRFGPDTGSP